MNSLNAISFPYDEIKDIKHTYSQIRQVIDIGCSTKCLLPDIEHETSVPDFFQHLVPPTTHNFYGPILCSYKSISNALLNFFMKKETVSDSATRVATAVSSVTHTSDGFVYLATVLHKLLPQFGGQPLDLLDEMKNLFISNGEDLEDFHKRALALQTRLELSRMTVPPTLVAGRYLALLNTCPSIYNRNFARHKREIGDHIAFPENIDDVYEHLIESKKRVCDLCDGPHDVDSCYKRGLSFMPPSMAKKVLRYNEIHGSVPKEPKKDAIQTPFKPRYRDPKKDVTQQQKWSLSLSLYRTTPTSPLVILQTNQLLQLRTIPTLFPPMESIIQSPLLQD